MNKENELENFNILLKEDLDKYNKSDRILISNLDGSLSNFLETEIMKKCLEKSFAEYLSWLDKIFSNN
jgi:hypothetical protein